MRNFRFVNPNTKKYYESLCETPTGKVFAAAAEQVFLSDEYAKRESVFAETVTFGAAPIISAYVLWMLKRAIEQGIKRIYFLARDGRIMYESAVILCKKFGLDIDCRYLYCSRQSLRPALFAADYDEALCKLCADAMSITPSDVLSKIYLTDEEKAAVFDDIGLTDEQRAENLNHRTMENFRSMLKESEVFERFSTEKSTLIYENVIGYLKSEGMFEDIKYAVADSGWVGSVQRTLRILLESVTKTRAEMYGFYFGITEPVSPDDGVYDCFYIKSPCSARLVYFNNNLFECFCAADHGMTIGYGDESDGFKPLLMPHKENSRISDIHETVSAVTENLGRLCSFENIRTEVLDGIIEKNVGQLFSTPSRKEAEAFGGISFCDDTTEAYLEPLADRKQLGQLMRLTVFARTLHKLFGLFKPVGQPFWTEGSIALQPQPIKAFLRLDHCLLCLIKRVNLKRKGHNK